MKVSTTGTLKSLVKAGMISIDDAVSPARQEEAMRTILDGVHPYKITEPKPGNKDLRWSTYVADPTKAEGRRKIFRNSKSELFAFLINHYGLAKDTELTFGELYNKFVDYKKLYTSNITNSKKSKSPSTIRRFVRDYENTLKDTVLDKMRLSDVTNIIVEEVFIEVAHKKGLSESYVSNLLGYVCGALEYAFKSKLIATNEGACVDRALVLSHAIPSKPVVDEERVLTADEVIALYQATRKQIEAHPTYMPNYGILLALMTGMRVGEVAALRWSDVDDLYIHIDHSEHRIDYASHEEAVEQYDNLLTMYDWVEPKDNFLKRSASYIMTVGEPKNRKHRNFPMVPQIRALFDEIRALDVSNDNSFIFAKEGSIRHNGHDISCAIERRSKEANIKKASVHMLRRTFSSNALIKYPRELVAALLGHLENTNKEHYDYDVSTIEYKKEMISNLYSNVLKLKPIKMA
ncbi:MAG: tyrosine-type recombinase/integrase [Lachnospiraceae bacterium]|nr:tyrosine-type recombinase/integrase [Lachnospiraceae bacterium]